MASGIIRFLLLWLVLFLSWFVLRGNQVTREFPTTHEDVFTEEAYSAAPKQEPTPHLVTLSHTETIVKDNNGPSSLIVSPAIAPATPWAVIKPSPTPSDSIHNHGKYGETQSSEEETQTQESKGETVFTNDDEFIAEETKREKIKEVNHSKNDPDDLDHREPVKNQDSSSELPSIEVGSIDDSINEKNSVNKQDGPSQIKDSEGDKEEEARNDLRSSERSVVPEETVARYPPPGDSRTLDRNVEDFQAPDGDEDLVGGRDDLKGTPDDMPSFKEWSQKFLELEEQKNKVQQNMEKGNAEADTLKKKKKSDRKQNNYASLDCGAKILEKNAEAQHAESILLENKDLYMLNPCSANIWFIVELCDHVQVTSLQLANFELFSSTTKKFQVSFSTRYPTRDWTQLQTFTAKSEKTIQTFTIDPIFAKYIKVEQLSFHGSEHYCPWSLLRVYGNSMVEEYEEHVSSQNAESPVEDEEIASSSVSEDKQASNGILKSATDAVLNFVKETAKKLVNGNVATNSSSDGVNQTNSSKQLESPSQRPLDTETPKTIVELMNREDFEANCHEVTDESLVGKNNRYWPKSVCGSTECTVNSYPTFIEIIHNVCRRDSRNLKTCYTNLTKTLAVNKSMEALALKPKAKPDKAISENANALEKDDTVKKPPQQKTSGFSRRENSEKRENTGLPAVSSNDESFDEIADKGDSSQVFHSQSSLESSVVGQVEKSDENSPDVASIVPSLSSPIESSTSSISLPKETEHSASPTPLTQPPLAERQPPYAAELLTERAVTDSEGQQGNQANSVVSSTDLNADATRPGDLPISKVTSGQLSGSEYISPSSASVETIPSEYSASVSGEKLIASSSTNAAFAGDDASKAESLNEKSPGAEEQDLMLESMKGTSEDNPNPYVDVLKITLTDDKTKEGTAELEQTARSNVGGSSSSERGMKESLTKDNMMDQKMEENEETEPSGLKERKSINVSDKHEAGKNVEPLSRIDEKDISTTTTRSEDSGEDHPVKSKREHEKYEKDEENQMGNVSSQNHEVAQEKPEPVDQNILEKNSFLNSEDKCEEKKHEVEKSDEENIKSLENKVYADEARSENTSSADQEPGAPVPVGNGQTNSKKESIFVAMSRKIKALEQNVTMTNLFLEELSQRYRKSLEDMQKLLDKKLSKMSKNSKLLTAVNLSQNSTIMALTSRLQKVEQELNETKSRVKVINQEVVERHILGMCLQFTFLILLWFLARTRRASVTKSQSPGESDMEDESLKNSALHRCPENRKLKIGNGLTKGIVAEEIELDGIKRNPEKLLFSKPPSGETTTEGKRRRRRKNRPSSGSCEQFLKHDTNSAQNIVTKTAGLLFHSPESHHDERTVKHVTEDTAQRSVCAEVLNALARTDCEKKLNMERPAVFPKKKKVVFRYGEKRENEGSKVYTNKMEQDGIGHKGLVRSKSLGQFNKDEATSRHNDLTCSSPNCSLLSRCFLQSSRDSHQLKNQKSGWIWGPG